MGLEEYQRKRDFDRTAEPRGDRAAEAGARYVVHKHAARKLHYDLRLEYQGVLMSWAVPKGPSLDPRDKRLAVQVEDHPVEYGEFEGMIPEGAYGGGPSALWDRGRWQPLDEVSEGLARGRLRFRLDGERLGGVWNLVRMAPKGKERHNWLLIKEDDEVADASRDILTKGPDSIKSGRSLEEIRQQPDSLADYERAQAEVPPARAGELPGAKRATLPREPKAELATLVERVPTGDDWLHEIKLDGYRLLCRLHNGKARLLTRNGNDWTHRFPDLAAAAARLPVTEALLDGEVVVLRPDGTSDFQALQNVLKEGAPGVLHYYLFDLPHCEGYDLARTPLLERKRLLAALLSEAPHKLLRYSDHVLGHGEAMYAEACRQGLEGLICKRADSPYQGRRSRDWLKVKCTRRQELVIGGYTEPQGSRQHFGALLLGYYDDAGRLQYAGKVGTGFNADTLRELHAMLERRERITPPFASSPGGREALEAHWVKPELVAEISFTEWTGDGRLRHPSFLGLREDKRAAEVVREHSAPAPAAAHQPAARPRPAASTRTPAGDAELAGVRLSNPDRILFPDQGVSKRALAEYYAAVAEHMLPHVADRPLSLVRCPRGRDKHCFFQRHLSEAMPRELRAVPIEEKQKTAEHVVLHDLPGLIALVQMGVLEIHPWPARADRPDRPDRLVMDLDPGPGTDWEAVKRGALELRERLGELGLESFLLATGGKGLHVIAPVTRQLDWDIHKAFAKALAQQLERDAPRRYTANMSKAKRHGRIFVDYLRNGRGATAIAPYSSRARQGAPVAVPLAWEELPKLRAANLYNVDNLPQRLAQEQDPWADFFELRQTINKAMRRRLGLEA